MGDTTSRWPRSTSEKATRGEVRVYVGVMILLISCLVSAGIFFWKKWRSDRMKRRERSWLDERAPFS